MGTKVDLQLSYTEDYWKESSFEENGGMNKGNLRKIKTLQADLLQLTEDLSLSERARRSAELERNDLHEQIAQYENNEMQMTNEKRRLEARISNLEEELDEEQTMNEQCVELTRKTQLYAQQLSTELATERSESARQESFRLQFERHNKELKEKNAEQETLQRAKIKAIIAEFETKIANLEEQVESEEKERLEQQRTNRKLDKKIKMLMVQLADEQRHTHLHQEQLERSNARIKLLKQQLEEADEEIFREKTEKRKLQKECADLLVSYESLTREVSIFKLRQEIDVVSSRMNDSKHCSLSPIRDKGSGDNPELDTTKDSEKNTELSYLPMSQ